MNSSTERIIQFKGTPVEIGIAAGRRLGPRLEENIARYLRKRPQSAREFDLDRLRAEVIPVLRKLPARFQEELEGLATGAGIPLQRVAEWIALDQYLEAGCSGFITEINGHAWVGRNNDFRIPEAHGYVTIREVNDRIPTMMLGMEGSIFTASGINREQLWIHSHFLPVSDTPRPDRLHYPDYVILAEALETCSDIHAVEQVLHTIDRDNGGLWFVVDGKTDEFVIFEYSCRDFTRHVPVDGSLYGTNHTDNTEPAEISESSLRRLNRLTELVDRMVRDKIRLPDDLIVILAADLIEQRSGEYTTVESMVACPTKKKLWYTLGGYPAASSGNWLPVEWPW